MKNLFNDFIDAIVTTFKKIFILEKSSQTWAEREIEIACRRERNSEGGKECGWDYGVACYESAYRAYKSLLKDQHSGMSISFTKEILNRLINHKPLTPIEDTPWSWGDITGISRSRGVKVILQCKRMSSLFKYIYDDGTIKYRDVDAYIGIDISDNSSFHSGFVDEVMDEIFPITMPYAPNTRPIKVYCEEVLTDRSNGDFDTNAKAIHYAIKPDGTRIEINRFFKEPDSGEGWEEIDKDEFERRVTLDVSRKLDESTEKETKSCDEWYMKHHLRG